jgi:transposase-like protein
MTLHPDWKIRSFQADWNTATVTIDEVCRRHGLTLQTAYNKASRLRTQGWMLVKRERGRGRVSRWTEEQQAELIRLRVTTKLTVKQISDEMGFSASTLEKKIEGLLLTGLLPSKYRSRKPEPLCSIKHVLTKQKEHRVPKDLPLTPWNIRKELRELGCVVDGRQTPAGLLVYINRRAQAYTIPEQIGLGQFPRLVGVTI